MEAHVSHLFGRGAGIIFSLMLEIIILAAFWKNLINLYDQYTLIEQSLDRDTLYLCTITERY